MSPNLTANRAMLLLKKNSPELLMAGGIVGFIGVAIGIGVASWKMKPIYSDMAYTLNSLKDASLRNDTYTPEQYKKDRVRLIGQFVLYCVQLYGPSVALGILSTGMLVGSNRVLNRRNVALMGAYKLLDSAFKEYRRHVEEDLGKNADEYFNYADPDKEPKEVKKKVDFEKVKPDGYPSVYARYFDSFSPQWRQEKYENEFFLEAQQRFANQLLQTREHVFLNEVYDALGIPRTPEGAIVGWVKDHGDNFIKIKVIGEPGPTSMLLDFNVDGIIYDMI